MDRNELLLTKSAYYPYHQVPHIYTEQHQSANDSQDNDQRYDRIFGHCASLVQILLFKEKCHMIPHNRTIKKLCK